MLLGKQQFASTKMEKDENKGQEGGETIINFNNEMFSPRTTSPTHGQHTRTHTDTHTRTHVPTDTHAFTHTHTIATTDTHARTRPRLAPATTPTDTHTHARTRTQHAPTHVDHDLTYNSIPLISGSGGQGVQGNRGAADIIVHTSQV